MIHKEAWYRELRKLSDALQYPTEITDIDPSLRRELKEVTLEDFSKFPDRINGWAFFILLSLGPSKRDQIQKLLDEAQEAWTEWYDLRQQAKHETIDQRRMHLLERELLDWTYRFHVMYEYALSMLPEPGEEPYDHPDLRYE